LHFFAATLTRDFEMIIESPFLAPPFAAPAFFFAAISSTPFSRPPTMRNRCAIVDSRLGRSFGTGRK